ncbi:MAG: carbamoyl phosphate synthase small subunit [Treponema sp.]|nr:carbamoyl phosphate synthase small subunit [Treponema sp.]
MAYLILADGSVFEGKSIGATGETIGETVFTTGMTGYLETLTDPSYFGQIVTQTFPLIGNYGFIPEDYESKKSWIRGYIVRELCEMPSNFRCEGTLDAFLKSQNIVGICGIDTRALTKKLRESGVMNGMITSSDVCPKVDQALLKKIGEYKIEKAVESVQNGSTLAKKDCSCGSEEKQKHIVLWDFGAKMNIQRELEKRGAKVTVIPFDTTAEQIIKMNPDGLMLSNGPGDPAENVGIISEIAKLCQFNSKGENIIPIFGICLGHQLLALARGAKTSKLKYGHRGGNHPVKDLDSGRVYISSQNHGYAVEIENLPECAKLAFVNSNDGTCEGLVYNDIPAFSVQFHPEACGGPHDTNFLFDKFIEMINQYKK